jgi:hypothetical protein
MPSNFLYRRQGSARTDQTDSLVKLATLPCARITLIKFQGVISANALANISTPSVDRNGYDSRSEVVIVGGEWEVLALAPRGSI